VFQKILQYIFTISIVINIIETRVAFFDYFILTHLFIYFFYNRKKKNTFNYN